MILFDNNALYLHASSVVTDAGAILFLGHSTAGKSTIARILSEAFPILADDTVLVFRDSTRGWQVANGEKRLVEAGTYLIKNSQIKNAPSHPLLGCFRLYKAETVKAVSIEPIRLAQYLMDAVMEVDVNRVPKRLSLDNATDLIGNCRRRRGQNFHLVAEISRLYPGWELYFSRKSACLELVSRIEAKVMTGTTTEIRGKKNLDCCKELKRDV